MQPALATTARQAVSIDLLAQTWLGHFATRRGELTTQVPSRSPDPGRYRDLIVTVAEQVLLAIVTGDVSDADYNPSLRAAYSGWFLEPGCAQNTSPPAVQQGTRRRARPAARHHQP